MKQGFQILHSGERIATRGAVELKGLLASQGKSDAP
jgi:hypothetical protein